MKFVELQPWNKVSFRRAQFYGHEHIESSDYVKAATTPVPDLFSRLCKGMVLALLHNSDFVACSPISAGIVWLWCNHCCRTWGGARNSDSLRTTHIRRCINHVRTQYIVHLLFSAEFANFCWYDRRKRREIVLLFFYWTEFLYAICWNPAFNMENRGIRTKMWQSWWKITISKMLVN